MDGKRGPTMPAGFEGRQQVYLSVEGEQFHRALANVITRYREERGWTLAQLAELSNVKKSVLSRLGRARREIRFEHIIRISMAFGVPLEELVRDARLLAFPDGMPQHVTLRCPTSLVDTDLDDELDGEPATSLALMVPCPW